MERIFATQIAKRASRIMGRVASVHLPAPVLKPLIGAYARSVGASLEEAEEPAGGFKSFGDFFGRRLRPEARPVCQTPGALVSPCDGELLDFGGLDLDRQSTFLIKDSRYHLDSLLGCESSDKYRGGGYLVIYLHPRDYHRVHAPADSNLKRIRHIPGTRYPVNDWLKDKVDAVYGKNERVVFHFDLATGAEFALVMVAAFGVGNIETRFPIGSAWGPDVARERDFESPMEMQRGDEVGTFLIGSTAVMVWSEGAFNLDKELHCGTTAMGRQLGMVADS